MSTIHQMHLPHFDPMIKLAVVEELLRRILDPVPSRHTIVGWIEEGKLEGRQFGTGRNWYVYQSSLQNFIDETFAPRQQKLAA